jgi:hypothetical protein
MAAPLIGAAAVAAGKVVAKKVATETAKKAAAKKLADSLKKSGIEKLNKINRTTKESDILYALRHGKITQKEAAAIDPKKFPLPDKSKIKVIGTIDLNTGKVTRGK